MEYCVKCDEKLTKDTVTHHHCLPKFHYKGRGMLVPMCKACHKQIEKIYQRAENNTNGTRKALTEFEYYTLYYQFVWGKDYEVYLEF